MRPPVKKIIIYGVAFNSIRMLIGAISAVYLIAVGLEIKDVGFLKAFQASVIFILDIPLAYIADKRSRRLSVIGSVFFGAIWLFAMGYGSEIYHFYIAEFFNAISLALFSGAYVSYLIDKGKEDNCPIKELLGKYNKFVYFGMGIAALLGSAFITVDSRVIWYISGVLLGLQFLLLSSMLPEDKKFETEKKPNMYREISEILKDILVRAEIKWLVFCVFLAMIYFQVIIQFWQLVVQQASGEGSEHGIFYGVIFTLVLFAQSVSGHVAEKKSDQRNVAFVVGSGVLSSFLLAWPYGYSMYFISASVILMFFSNRLMTLVLLSKIHENIDGEMRSTYDSVISTVTRLFLLIFIPIIGIGFELYGNIVFLFLFAVTLITFWVKRGELQLFLGNEDSNGRKNLSLKNILQYGWVSNKKRDSDLRP